MLLSSSFTTTTTTTTTTTNTTTTTTTNTNTVATVASVVPDSKLEANDETTPSISMSTLPSSQQEQQQLHVHKKQRPTNMANHNSNSYNDNDNDQDEDDNVLFWKVGDQRPPELKADPFIMSMIPKPCAWISINDQEVALIEGYNVANHAPPTLMMASEALSTSMMQELRNAANNNNGRLATLSIATEREQHCLFTAAAAADAASCSNGETPRPQNFSFQALKLVPDSSKKDRPPAVASSPIKMYCRLSELVELGNDQFLVLLEVESFVFSPSILSPPDATSTRKTLAKIDAELMKPVASMGQARFATMDRLHLMLRPRPSQDTWISDPFALATPTVGPATFLSKEVEYVFRQDTSSLGYNPVKAVVLPRPIGWISTYTDPTRSIPHVAPYSFFGDVGRGDRPMVAFASWRSSSGIDGGRKDAQLDTERMGCFCVNIVSEELAVPMNTTAGEMKRNESEFHVSGLTHSHASLVNAPFVDRAHIVMQAKYVKTVDVGSFSVVIGEIVGIRMAKNILTCGLVDCTKLKPLTRLGYEDEYAVMDRYLLPSQQQQQQQ